MKFDVVAITKAIVERYFEKLMDNLEIDVVFVDGGLSGLVAGYFLAQAGQRVALYERKLSVGGGMWGGGMLFNEIVIQEDARRLLDEFEVRTVPYKERGYYSPSAV